MLIHCPQCNAGYEFPVEQLPPDGLRAKCARCSFVMLIKAGEGAIDPDTGLAQVPFKRRPGGSEVTTEVGQREEKAVDAGPKVVIDMGQLSDTPAAEGEAEDDGLPPPIDLASFAPLAAKPVLAESPSRPVANLPPPAHIDPSEIREVRPPGMGRLVLIVMLLGASLFALFVAARNDWQIDWADPMASVSKAFDVKERPRVPSKTPTSTPVVEVDEMKGQLELRELTVQHRRGYALVQGTLVNASNRVQRGIGFEIGLTRGPGKPPLKARTVACCDRFTAAEADGVAKKADHPHFSESLNRASALRLMPNEVRPFSVIMRNAPGRARHATGRVKFAEVESPGAARP